VNKPSLELKNNRLHLANLELSKFQKFSGPSAPTMVAPRVDQNLQN